MKIEVEADDYQSLMNENDRLRVRNTELQRDMTNLVQRTRLEKVGGILSGKAIEDAVLRGDIEITPFKKEHINPCSVDLTLGSLVREYKFRGQLVDTSKPPEALCLDSAIEQETFLYEIPAERGFVLYPGRLYLMHTEERVFTPHFVPVVDGKSSIGRLGLWVHITAGYGENGFDGQYTLEMTPVLPVKIYAGMRIAQIRFQTLAGERTDYRDKGNYVGSAANGPVPSMSWKQFK